MLGTAARYSCLHDAGPCYGLSAAQFGTNRGASEPNGLETFSWEFLSLTSKIVMRQLRASIPVVPVFTGSSTGESSPISHGLGQEAVVSSCSIHVILSYPHLVHVSPDGRESHRLKQEGFHCTAVHSAGS